MGKTALSGGDQFTPPQPSAACGEGVHTHAIQAQKKMVGLGAKIHLQRLVGCYRYNSHIQS